MLESFSSCSTTENWDTTLPNGVDSYILACALKEPPRRGIKVSGIHYFILHSCIHSSMHACIYPSIYPFILFFAVSCVYSSNFGMGLPSSVGKR